MNLSRKEVETICTSLSEAIEAMSEAPVDSRIVESLEKIRLDLARTKLLAVSDKAIKFITDLANGSTVLETAVANDTKHQEVYRVVKTGLLRMLEAMNMIGLDVMFKNLTNNPTAGGVLSYKEEAKLLVEHWVKLKKY